MTLGALIQSCKKAKLCFLSPSYICAFVCVCVCVCVCVRDRERLFACLCVMNRENPFHSENSGLYLISLGLIYQGVFDVQALPMSRSFCTLPSINFNSCGFF